MEKPLIKIRQAPNYPDYLEVDLVWPGKYRSMMTVSKTSSKEEVSRAVEYHSSIIKREISVNDFYSKMMEVNHVKPAASWLPAETDKT